MSFFPVGIFDSGAGGLTVLSACRALLPYEDFIYLADVVHAPYGNKANVEIAERVFSCSERLIALNCKAIVVACNTATGVGIKMLRERYARPFVGVEPAIKPAAEAGIRGDIVVLCTEAAARQEKLKALLIRCAEGYNGRIGEDKKPSVTVAPQARLATLIEAHVDDLESIRPALYEILSPHASAAALVLGCTHYVFLKDMIADFYRERERKIQIFDGNHGAARRLKYLLKQGGMLTNKKTVGSVKIIFK